MAEVRGLQRRESDVALDSAQASEAEHHGSGSPQFIFPLSGAGIPKVLMGVAVLLHTVSPEPAAFRGISRGTFLSLKIGVECRLPLHGC